VRHANDLLPDFHSLFFFHSWHCRRLPVSEEVDAFADVLMRRDATFVAFGTEDHLLKCFIGSIG
jgi:hypothetical protein